jgi:hypothetical protein
MASLSDMYLSKLLSVQMSTYLKTWILIFIFINNHTF